MIKRLRKNIILVNMLLVGTVILLIFAAVCINSYTIAIKELEIGLTQVLERNMDDIKPPQRVFGNKRPMEISNPTQISSYILVSVDSIGNILNCTENNATIDDNALKDCIDTALWEKEQNGSIGEYNLIYAKKGNFNKTSIVFTDMSSVYSSLRNTLIISICLFIGSLGVVFLISLALSGIAVNPVKDAWNKQKRFVADASHELKTPLTVILANNNIMMSHKSSRIEDESKWLESTEEEAHHMKNLIDNMLFLAKADSDDNPPILSEVNISEIVEGASLNFEPIAFEKEINIATIITPNITLKSNATLFTQLAHILIDNAVKYGNSKSVVSIGLITKGDSVEFSVNNIGNIIAKEDLKHIFDRFYRTEKSRTTGGYGLGLSIAQNIVKNLNGKLSVESNEKSGTTFTAQFKK